MSHRPRMASPVCIRPTSPMFAPSTSVQGPKPVIPVQSHGTALAQPAATVPVPEKDVQCRPPCSSFHRRQQLLQFSGKVVVSECGSAVGFHCDSGILVFHRLPPNSSSGEVVLFQRAMMIYSVMCELNITLTFIPFNFLISLAEEGGPSVGKMEVAVSLYLGCLGTVPEKLQALANECSHIKDLQAQLVFLKAELVTMRAFLLKVAAMEQEGPLDILDIQLKVWAQEVRETSYDVEDCVDDFTRSLHLAGGGQQHQGSNMIINFLAKCSKILGTLLTYHRFADTIEALKTRVVDAGDRWERYKLDGLGCCSSNLTMDPRLSALFTEESRLAGIEKPRDELVRWLVGPEGGLATHLRVLSIVGFGGLGKTTLAREVHRKVVGDFPCKIFVSVSQKPDLCKILRDCLSQLVRGNQISGDIEAWNEVKLITEIRDYLADKRYLVVIDDVWSTAAWEAIRCAFPENNCSSRMITTTRIVSVAHSCSSVDGRIYEMEPLSFHQSKWLFLKRLFGSEECPDQLQEVSDAIVKKCGGLPLAIINISGLLTTRAAVKEEWSKIKDSLGSALENNRDLEGLNSILMLSYVALPQNLRTCLLYLSMFPEDCKINRDRLVSMWISERFVAEERGRTLQEVGEGYFDELINRSLLQATDMGYDGKARGCTIHDIMLDLIISKACDENFVSIVGCQGLVRSPKGSIRRLCLQQPEKEATSGLQGKVSHTRSLSCFGQVRNLPGLEEFQCLRVLDLEGLLDMNSFDLSKIEKLTRLTYLSLRNTFISEIPTGVAKLLDLEILYLRDTRVTELPAGIVCLRKLRQLLTGGVDQGLTKIPDGIGKMESLQVVVGFNIMRSSIDAIKDLRYLINLKELSIQFNTIGYDQTSRHEEVLFSSLCKLGNNLQSVWIRSIDSASLQFLESWSPLPVLLQRFRMSTNFYFLKTPNWFLPELNSLYSVSINIVDVTQEELEILSKLCALTVLDLWFKVDPKEKITFPRGGFKSLKLFNFVRRPYVVRGMGYLVFEAGVLPKLERLSIPFSISMAKGHDFYVGIVHLRSLTHAEVILGKDGATPSEVKAAAESIEKEVSANPNHPELSIEGSHQ
ncbi:hypothetical protein HU200_049498 [Digitaria exilis]|uniref:Uncharacterized protein n=1 Tax=Digitaria exilis TaxID=1010633 RepID=A0A835ATE3_9POAL|nr:hypothetical protein HU200_049498 [Digitaria exilis]